MLSVANIDLFRGDNHVIRGMSFHVERGDLVCLLGPSGCGKTTMLRLIAGLERPDAGTIVIDGRTATSRKRVLAPHKRKIGFLFQDFALFPNLTVAQNIAYGLSSLSKEESAARTREVLQQIRMLDHADKYPHMLSGGEQQRVAFARARAPRPPLLLLDEPFSGLDTALRRQIRDETLHILKDRGITTVMVTHDPEEAMLMADRIILMKDGAVVQAGTPEELYHHPVDAFAAEFFGDVNRLKGTVEGEWIQTEMGPLANPEFPDGSEVDVLIRPDGLKLSNGDRAGAGGEAAKVCDVRYAGRATLVRLEIGNGPRPRTHVHARHHLAVPLREGDRLRIDLDRDQTFVFQSS